MKIYMRDSWRHVKLVSKRLMRFTSIIFSSRGVISAGRSMLLVTQPCDNKTDGQVKYAILKVHNKHANCPNPPEGLFLSPLSKESVKILNDIYAWDNTNPIESFTIDMATLRDITGVVDSYRAAYA